MVVCAVPQRAAEAARLADRLGLALVREPPETPDRLVLILAEGRLQLQVTGPDAPGAVYAEFAGGRTGWRGRRPAVGGDALARAAGVRRGERPDVIDATAGLGRDAFVLAALGCEVTLVERDPIVDALLADGLERALRDPAAARIVTRMQHVHADACAWLHSHHADVVLVDPMHPPRRKAAAVRKEMRVFRALVGPDTDSGALLAAAITAARRRVVVKRPRGADPIPGPRPSGSVDGRSTRFDIYAGQAQGPGRSPGKA